MHITRKVLEMIMKSWIMFLVFLRCRLYYYYYYYFIYIVLLLLPSQTKHSTVFSFKKNPNQVKLLRYTHPPIYHSIKLLYSRNAQNVYLFKQVTTFFSYYERAICPTIFTRQQPCTKYRHRQAGRLYLFIPQFLPGNIKYSHGYCKRYTERK